MPHVVHISLNSKAACRSWARSEPWTVKLLSAFAGCGFTASTLVLLTTTNQVIPGAVLLSLNLVLVFIYDVFVLLRSKDKA